MIGMLNRTFCETWYLQLHHCRLLTLNTYYSQVSLSRTLCVVNYRYSTIVNTITLVINGNDAINIFAFHLSCHCATFLNIIPKNRLICIPNSDKIFICSLTTFFTTSPTIIPINGLTCNQGFNYVYLNSYILFPTSPTIVAMNCLTCNLGFNYVYLNSHILFQRRQLLSP